MVKPRGMVLPRIEKGQTWLFYRCRVRVDQVVVTPSETIIYFGPVDARGKLGATARLTLEDFANRIETWGAKLSKARD